MVDIVMEMVNMVVDGERKERKVDDNIRKSSFQKADSILFQQFPSSHPPATQSLGGGGFGDAGMSADQGRGSSIFWELLLEQQGHVAGNNTVSLPGTGRGSALAAVDIIVA